MSSLKIADRIAAELPFLRRYARALTGSQNGGDGIATATLESILEDFARFDETLDPRVALYKLFHQRWEQSNQEILVGETEHEKRAQRYMAVLTNSTREALLLHTVEEFSVADVASILSVPHSEAENLIEIAFREMAQATSGKVMIIEDEPVIYVDLQEIVKSMGHQVTGIARTEDEAIALASQAQPDLILSDIQLADDSSGIDAINRIIDMFPATPVVLVTAFPERYLTGETREPAFLISKPYQESQIRAAVSQALFFSSVDILQSAG